jgi:hypothetical protein
MIADGRALLVGRAVPVGRESLVGIALLDAKDLSVRGSVP